MDQIEKLSEEDLFEKAFRLLDFAEGLLERYLSEKGFSSKEELVKLLAEKGFGKDGAEEAPHSTEPPTYRTYSDPYIIYHNVT